MIQHFWLSEFWWSKTCLVEISCRSLREKWQKRSIWFGKTWKWMDFEYQANGVWWSSNSRNGSLFENGIKFECIQLPKRCTQVFWMFWHVVGHNSNTFTTYENYEVEIFWSEKILFFDLIAKFQITSSQCFFFPCFKFGHRFRIKLGLPISGLAFSHKLCIFINNNFVTKSIFTNL